MIRIGAVLAIGGFVFLVVMSIFFPSEQKERLDEHAVALEEQIHLAPDIEARTVKGYHLVRAVSAWWRPADGVEQELEVQITKERPPPAEFEILTHKTTGKVLNRSAIEPEFAVRLPADTALLGQAGVVTLEGKLDYPIVDAFEFGGGSSKTGTEEFQLERKVLFVSAAAIEQARAPRERHWTVHVGTATVMIGIFVLVIGLVASLFRRR